MKLKKTTFARAGIALLLAASLATPLSAELLNGPASKAKPDKGTQGIPSYTQITRIFENWSLQCRENTSGSACYLETAVRQNEPKVRELLVMRLSLAADGGLRASIVTPNRVKLDRGVELALGGVSFTAPYTICGPVNCNASLPSQANLADLLATNETIETQFYILAPADQGGEKGVKFAVSLNGLADALGQLRVYASE